MLKILSFTRLMRILRIELVDTYFYLRYHDWSQQLEGNGVWFMCIFLMSHGSLCEIYCFSPSPCLFSNTYVLYTIRKCFWCRLNRTFVCRSVCLSVLPLEYRALLLLEFLNTFFIIYMKRKRRKNPVYLWTTFLNIQIKIQDIREYIRLLIHANNAWVANPYPMLNTGMSAVQWSLWEAVVVWRQLANTNEGWVSCLQ